MKDFKAWTEADVREHNARVAKENRIPVAESGEGCKRESDLHDQIMAECRRRGWLVVHSRMDRPTTCGVGTPDFVICGETEVDGSDGFPTVWLVECKSANGKLSTAQHAMIAQAARFGHTVHVVRSFDEFLKLL